MRLPVKDKPFTWSPSALKAWNTCPVQYWNKYWNPEGVYEPPGEAAKWGIDVHKAFEDCVLNGESKLPDRYSVYQKWLDAVWSMGGDKVPEQKKGFSILWNEVDFFDHTVFLRLIIDLTVKEGSSAYILDYKTGKSRYDNDDQLKLGAISAFISDEEVKTVKAGYIYLKEDFVTKPLVFEREQLMSLQIEFGAKIDPMKADCFKKEFEPKPSGLCKKWCDVTICPHNGNYR